MIRAAALLPVRAGGFALGFALGLTLDAAEAACGVIRAVR